ncbi:MAG: hypothetical protein BYD32DRAFT_298357 [Podila humilis]|nr:MAG: hypothetical protein BYD32DRAFT_298357 [Podila humilis]
MWEETERVHRQPSRKQKTNKKPSQKHRHTALLLSSLSNSFFLLFLLSSFSFLSSNGHTLFFLSPFVFILFVGVDNQQPLSLFSRICSESNQSRPQSTKSLLHLHPAIEPVLFVFFYSFAHPSIHSSIHPSIHLLHFCLRCVLHPPCLLHRHTHIQPTNQPYATLPSHTHHIIHL